MNKFFYAIGASVVFAVAVPAIPADELGPPSQAFRVESVPPAPAEEAPAQGPHSGHGAMHGGH